MISRTPREGEAAEADEYDRENENHKSTVEEADQGRTDRDGWDG